MIRSTDLLLLIMVFVYTGQVRDSGGGVVGGTTTSVRKRWFAGVHTPFDPNKPCTSHMQARTGE